MDFENNVRFVDLEDPAIVYCHDEGEYANYNIPWDYTPPNLIEVPKSGMGEISDGYHTFNSLYYQRLVLFATIVNTYKQNSWKSRKHEDGKKCFDSDDWFIVGVDTPEGSYTYHYESKYWDMFDCVELPVAKHWDGHTDKDVCRLLSLCGADMREES